MEQNESKTDVSSEEIEDILENYKTVAVVGLSPKEDSPSYKVASYLQSKGFRGYSHISFRARYLGGKGLSPSS